MHRVKQAHAAERLGVVQSTISRWEAGLQAMSAAERCAIGRIVAARLDNAADRVLAGLITDTPRAVHLICDHSHRLLTCSASRACEFGIDAHALLGTSLQTSWQQRMIVSAKKAGMTRSCRNRW